MDKAGTERVYGYIEKEPALSQSDAFALSLAKKHGVTLLTGDAKLRALANNEGVDCHGLLWLLDRMFEGACISLVHNLHDGLQKILAHPRCRLPEREANQQLKTFADAIAKEGLC